MAVKNVVHRPRAAGKTHMLAEMTKLNDGLLITWNIDMAQNLRRQYGLREDQVMSYHQLRDRGTRGMRPRPIYIDDAELILRDLLRLDRIDGMAISNDVTPSVRRASDF